MRFLNGSLNSSVILMIICNISVGLVHKSDFDLFKVASDLSLFCVMCQGMRTVRIWTLLSSGFQ